MSHIFTIRKTVMAFAVTVLFFSMFGFTHAAGSSMIDDAKFASIKKSIQELQILVNQLVAERSVGKYKATGVATTTPVIKVATTTPVVKIASSTPTTTKSISVNTTKISGVDTVTFDLSSGKTYIPFSGTATGTKVLGFRIEGLNGLSYVEDLRNAATVGASKTWSYNFPLSTLGSKFVAGTYNLNVYDTESLTSDLTSTAKVFKVVRLVVTGKVPGVATSTPTTTKPVATSTQPVASSTPEKSIDVYNIYNLSSVVSTGSASKANAITKCQTYIATSTVKSSYWCTWGNTIIYGEGPVRVKAISSSASVKVNNPGTQIDDAGEYVMKFNIASIGSSDISVQSIATYNSNNAGINYVTKDINGNTLDNSYGKISTAVSSLATKVGQNYIIRSGESKDFQLNITYDPIKSAGMMYRQQLYSVNFQIGGVGPVIKKIVDPQFISDGLIIQNSI